MIGEQVTLITVPGAYWTGESELASGLASLVAEALATERRLAKGVDGAAERRRYMTWCKAIEDLLRPDAGSSPLGPDGAAAVLAETRLATFQLPGTFLDLMRSAGGAARSGSTFYPPATISEHLDAWQRLTESEPTGSPAHQRTQLLRAALDAGDGIVEVYDLHTPGASPIARPPDRLGRSMPGREKRPGPTFLPSSKATDDTFEVDLRRRQASERLRVRISAALASGDALTFGSEEQHDVITEVLHQFAYVSDDARAPDAELLVAYVDGSGATPFPVLRLLAQEPAPGGPPDLVLGLMSMRHPEIDPSVDAYWFRNNSVSVARTLGATDDYCYRASLRGLSELLGAGPTVVHVVHTGFEPAVVGFYRAVTELAASTIGSSSSGLTIVPRYLNARAVGDGLISGHAWTIGGTAGTA